MRIFALLIIFLRVGEGEGVGGIGPKDIGLLQSALARPHTSFDGRVKWRTVHEKAATLLYGLIKNHPFHDANKRTALLSTVHYLYSNGYSYLATPDELEDLTVLVADNGLSKFPRFRDLERESSDPEIEYLAWHFRTKTHLTDRRQYMITYRELEKILKKYDVLMENPNNNQIDIVQWQTVEVPRRSIFFSRPTTQEVRRVCTLGFPGWSKVVGKGRLKHVRDQLGLNPENGVDAQSFFNGVDDMRVLLDLYEGALRRLAYR